MSTEGADGGPVTELGNVCTGRPKLKADEGFEASCANADVGLFRDVVEAGVAVKPKRGFAIAAAVVAIE